MKLMAPMTSSRTRSSDGPTFTAKPPDRREWCPLCSR
jgi:hypothetical protein